mgnify:CR=1 FL=1
MFICYYILAVLLMSSISRMSLEGYSLKTRLPFLVLVVAMMAAVTLSLKAGGSEVTFVFTPSSLIFDANNVVGAVMDAAPGYKSGSFKSNGVAKTDMYWTPESLFGGREVTLGQVASLSYWTKKDTVQP